MKVNLFVSRDVEEPYADIHTDELTDNITKAMSILESEDSNEMLAVKKGSDIALLEFSDVYMFRVENKQVKVYTDSSEYLRHPGDADIAYAVGRPVVRRAVMHDRRHSAVSDRSSRRFDESLSSCPQAEEQIESFLRVFAGCIRYRGRIVRMIVSLCYGHSPAVSGKLYVQAALAFAEQNSPYVFRMGY